MNETTNLLKDEDAEPARGDGRGSRENPMEERFKFRRVHEITGAFVLAVIAVLIAAAVWTGHSQRWFKSRVPLRISLPKGGAAGIREGSEVYFLGTLVGSVSDVVVGPTGRMEAEASIRRDFFRFVRVDSSAAVKKKFGVAGDSFFEITRGEGRPLPENNASIACTEQFESALESAIEEIHQQALAALKKTSAGVDTWTQLGADLGETRRRLDALAIRLENMAAGIEAGKGTAGKLITDTALADEAQHLLARANETMSEFQNAATNLNLAVKNVQNGTARLPEITEAAANEAKDLPGLVLQTQSSMIELERLVEALQREWLIRKYVNQTNPPPLRPMIEIPASEIKPAPSLHSPKVSAK
jgi:phospholipid/cholesterol/gamma-HCH transport system substrate-binding protein